jgi:hypothetical protein
MILIYMIAANTFLYKYFCTSKNRTRTPCRPNPSKRHGAYRYSVDVIEQGLPLASRDTHEEDPQGALSIQLSLDDLIAFCLAN